MKKIFTLFACIFGMLTANADEITIWEGTQEMPEWSAVDTWNADVTALVNNGEITVGTIMLLEVERTATDYSLIAPINANWCSVVNGKYDTERQDINIGEGQTSASFVFTQEGINAIKEAGFYLAGHGYTVKKVAYKNEAAPSGPSVVWEGTLDAPDWGPLSDVANAKVKELVSTGIIKVGTVFTVYGLRTAEDYCSIALVNEWWTSVIDGTTGDDRSVLTFEGTEPTSASFVASEETITQINNAGFYINGHGFTLTKIEVENTTAISALKSQTSVLNQKAYNLAGQRVGAGYKGIIIRNGKKYIK